MKLENYLKPFQSLLRNHDLHKISRRIIMSIESPAHVLMGLPDLIGFDDEIYAFMDFLAKHVQRKPKNYLDLGAKQPHISPRSIAPRDRQYPALR